MILETQIGKTDPRHCRGDDINQGKLLSKQLGIPADFSVRDDESFMEKSDIDVESDTNSIV